MPAMAPKSLPLFVLLATSAFAHLEPHLAARQASSHRTTKTGAIGTSTAATGTAGNIQTGTFQPIAATMTPEATVPLPTTYTAGATAPISGAPALPTSALTISTYPALDVNPPIDSAQMKTWLAGLDLSKIPNIPPTAPGGCANASNSAAIANAGASGTCWWTCGGCTRANDVTECPDKGTWGTSYDDGPSPDTPRLLTYLDAHQLKTTFFVVGSRVISRPEMLQYEYMAGHQISVHTWSHPALTTLTNEQVLSELLWTKKAIKDTIGVTPNTFRPPYGDIDDRVRALAALVGLTPIIWTSTGTGQTFDTEDWKIAAGTVSPAQVLSNFETILNTYTSLDTGFIVLEHDLYQASVDLAIEFVLPSAVNQTGLKLEPIVTCLGSQMKEAYIETSSNKTTSSSGPAPGSTGTGSAPGAGTSGTSGSSGASSNTSGASSGMVGTVGGAAAAVVAVGVALLL